ncbi:MAG: LysM peptidoglycan-binding domain-containing protein [Bacteroidetes bacterium]|nr:LysM peptidoglycan-binding domain-containing protein [Bacteroidota bacterium]
MKNILLVISLCVFLSLDISAQRLSPEQYIATYKDLAIREMKRMGVPASITLAQGLLETEGGNSALLLKSNNHFGIKCKSSWTGESVSHDDDAAGECFRVYKNAEDSYRDHSNFLKGNDRYAFLFKLDPADYKGWAYGLKKAGYATNPNYPQILINNIEKYKLQQYSLEALSDVPVFDATKYTNDPEVKSVMPDEESNSSSTNQEITINGCKALRASKGTSLLAIATLYNIPLSKLLEFNDLQNDGLLPKNQFIFLQKKQIKGDSKIYVAQRDESLYDISQKNGIQLKNLQAYNSTDNLNVLKEGALVNLQPLVVPAPSREIVSREPVEVENQKIHIVQAGESLYGLSKKYSLSVSDLKSLNQLSDDHLSIGQQLIISKK